MRYRSRVPFYELRITDYESRITPKEHRPENLGDARFVLRFLTYCAVGIHSTDRNESFMTNLTCDTLINPDYTPASQEMVVPGNPNVLAMFDGHVAAPIIVAEIAGLANAGKIFLIQAAMPAAWPTSTLP